MHCVPVPRIKAGGSTLHGWDYEPQNPTQTSLVFPLQFKELIFYYTEVFPLLSAPFLYNSEIV